MVRIDLVQTDFEVPEDVENVEICATLSGSDIERNLIVLLVTDVDTAQGRLLVLDIVLKMSYIIKHFN